MKERKENTALKWRTLPTCPGLWLVVLYGQPEFVTVKPDSAIPGNRISDVRAFHSGMEAKTLWLGPLPAYPDLTVPDSVPEDSHES